MNLVFLLSLLACGAGPTPEPEAKPTTEKSEPEAPEEAERSDVKAPGNLPVRTRAELEAEGNAFQACLDSCEKERSMEASPIETIRATCARSCDQEHSSGQVEVDDGPIGLPPPPG